ncbi:MAG TPA: DUF3788 domain-containing protein [Candidatus Erysipelatoclostridium merdavium]|uniref:DUF3788 domain-containing protein n=1 Tax=Candidatus Erysipelatoclostridium merdavium TaxID=2838566 RepID=A0A9D1XJ47_9FIRM|nr:DUF3788 domain-containing protein [Candidatus Erysipelatoclostridium merdavium]
MLEKIPTESSMIELLGRSLYEIWQQLCMTIDKKYEMDRIWNNGGKKWTYEYKYRRGGKTLCCLYAKSNCIGFMIIFGKDERARFEDIRDTLSDSICKQYDEAKTYRDGKWVMFEPTDTTEFDDYIKLLAIKRKPNRK